MASPGKDEPKPYTRFANALAKLRQEEQRIMALRNAAQQDLRGAKGRVKDQADRIEEWDKQLEDVKQAIALLESQDS